MLRQRIFCTQIEYFGASLPGGMLQQQKNNSFLGPKYFQVKVVVGRRDCKPNHYIMFVGQACMNLRTFLESTLCMPARYYQTNVPAGSPACGGDAAVYVFDMNQLSLPTPFYLFLCLLLSMALSTVFHSINSPDNSPLSHSVLPLLFLPLCESLLSSDIILCG